MVVLSKVRGAPTGLRDGVQVGIHAILVVGAAILTVELHRAEGGAPISSATMVASSFGVFIITAMIIHLAGSHWADPTVPPPSEISTRFPPPSCRVKTPVRPSVAFFQRNCSSITPTVPTNRS